MRVGILGGGQLARFLTTAAYHLGLDVSLFCDKSASATNTICPSIFIDENECAIQSFLDYCDVITFESENIPTHWRAPLAQCKTIYPALKALEIASDRFEEKKCFNRLNIPTNKFIPVNGSKELQAAAEKLGFPFILKQRSLGYDGKGQYVIRSENDLMNITSYEYCLAEAWVHYEREISIIGVRGQDNQTLFYDLSENTHVNGILYRTNVRKGDPLQKTAQSMLMKLLDDFNYIGVLALECFVQNEQLIANEIAPRVHNSGHWTMHGSLTSQFENHIRAVSGLPLGATDLRATHTTMFNVIGQKPNLNDILALGYAFYVDYCKTARSGRKLGHVNLVSDEKEKFNAFSSILETLILEKNI